MNRGGLDGATWTMDDRFTGYDAASIAACRLEGGKMLLRIDDSDAGTAETLEGCAEAVSELAARGLIAMVEPLPYHRETGRLAAAAQGRPLAGAGGGGRQRARHHQRLHLAEDAVLRRPGRGLRRRRRCRASCSAACPDPDPDAGPRVVGPGAHPADRARPGRGPGAALPARRRRVAAVDAAAAVLRAAAGGPVSLLREARDSGAPGSVVEITPEDAGWDWTGLRVLRLAAGGAADRPDRRVRGLRAAALGARWRSTGRRRGDVRPARPGLGVQPGHRLLLRRPRQCGRAGLRTPAPRWRCPRRGARRPCRRRTAPRRTCPSRCAAPARRPVRSPTSVFPASGTTRTS